TEPYYTYQPPTASTSTAKPWPPTPASPCRTARSWWTCSTRPTPSRSSTEPSTSTSTWWADRGKPLQTHAPVPHTERKRDGGFLAFGEKLCQVCIEKMSKFVCSAHFRIFERKDYS